MTQNGVVPLALLYACFHSNQTLNELIKSSKQSNKHSQNIKLRYVRSLLSIDLGLVLIRQRHILNTDTITNELQMKDIISNVYVTVGYFNAS